MRVVCHMLVLLQATSMLRNNQLKMPLSGWLDGRIDKRQDRSCWWLKLRQGQLGVKGAELAMIIGKCLGLCLSRWSRLGSRGNEVELIQVFKVWSNQEYLAFKQAPILRLTAQAFICPWVSFVHWSKWTGGRSSKDLTSAAQKKLSSVEKLVLKC